MEQGLNVVGLGVISNAGLIKKTNVVHQVLKIQHGETERKQYKYSFLTNYLNTFTVFSCSSSQV